MAAAALRREQRLADVQRRKDTYGFNEEMTSAAQIYAKVHAKEFFELCLVDARKHKPCGPPAVPPGWTAMYWNARARYQTNIHCSRLPGFPTQFDRQKFATAAALALSAHDAMDGIDVGDNGNAGLTFDWGPEAV